MNVCELIWRILLGIIKFIFGLLGASLIIATSLFKWANIAQLKQISDIGAILNLTYIIDIIIYALLGLGVLFFIISLIGLMGVCFANRVFLLIYECLLILFFVLHLAALILLLAMSNFIEQQYRGFLSTQMASINTNINLDAKCVFMRGLSSLFQCCGAQGPQEFVLSTNRVACCSNWMLTQGCAQPSVDWLRKWAIFLLVLPTAVILAIELSTLIGVPFLVQSITKRMKTIVPQSL